LAKFVDYDPDRGVETWEDSYEGKLQIHYRQDVEPLLDLAKQERNYGLADKRVNGKTDDIRLYARIPAVTIMEMRFKHGVDIFNKDHLKRAVELINREYPNLKATTMTHRIN
jgi:hypothetical protein